MQECNENYSSARVQNGPESLRINQAPIQTRLKFELQRPAGWRGKTAHVAARYAWHRWYRWYRNKHQRSSHAP